MTLEQAARMIGHGVVYAGVSGREDGMIVSVNDRYVFVLFRGDSSSKACEAGDLQPLREERGR